MTRRAHHLQDDCLFDYYFAEQRGDLIDPPVAEHLTDCHACDARFAEIARFMDGLRAQAEAEADAIFTPERLRAQQQLVAHRIEHVGRAARVITFPRPFAKRTILVPSSHMAPRWTAAWVAAALFIGVALGASYEFGWRGRFAPWPNTVAQTTAPRPSRLAPLATRDTGQAPDVADDDAFLSELDNALDRPRSRELQPFDALTPHVREVSDVR